MDNRKVELTEEERRKAIEALCIEARNVHGKLLSQTSALARRLIEAVARVEAGLR